MKDLNKLLEKARHSALYLWILNNVLWRMIPFNHPHKFKIVGIGENNLKIELPYRKVNFNHIKGIHACALATLCEYVSGLSLLRKLPAEKYRIILKSIHMTYHFQGKMDVSAEFGVSNDALMDIAQSLQETDAIFRELPVEVFDKNNNHICTGLINWQIKSWDKVKLKV